MSIPRWQQGGVLSLSPVLAPGVAWLVLAAAAGATGTGAVTAAAPVASETGVSHIAEETPEAARVGALFHGSLAGGHFCTASVVASPGRSLIITAAHCLAGRSRVVFAPGYRRGKAPYGVWRVTKAALDSQWGSSSGRDVDVAFAAVQPLDGRRIEEVVGGNAVGIHPGSTRRVTLVGYPDSKEVPIACRGRTSRHSGTQLRISCTAYSGGTSGSPWITDVDPATHLGTVIGVIGGYQRGGATSNVSYSSYFGDRVAALYREAIAEDA
jgi:V8-like Glu-specific endopeptidase